MVSVAGLAPARVGLIIRLRELLGIHGQKMVAAEGENPESLLADSLNSVNSVPPWRLERSSVELYVSCR